MGQSQQVAIAGAGIVGLACALALRRRGFAVTLLEAGTAMREASWAAGGMLAVDDPENPHILHEFSLYSRGLYDRFLTESGALSGQPMRYRTSRTVQIARCEEHAQAGRTLTHAEAETLAPGIAPAPAGHDFLLLEEQSLDPRDLCAALPIAARAAGAVLEEQTPVTAVETTENGVLVHTPRGPFAADAFLNCAGAWSAMLASQLAVLPRKGQMLAVQQQSGPLLDVVLRSADVYLIPRGAGRIAIGATVEHAGYSKVVEPGAIAAVQRRAAALFPAVATATVVETWAGLRPGSADDLPIVDQLGARLFAATGHYRNGILLAPGTAEAMADLICGVTPAIDVSPFRAARSAVGPSCDKHFAAAL